MGKSTLVDFSFVINPILYALEHGTPLKYIYFSYEIDRVKKEFDFASYFFLRDYRITEFIVNDVVYPMSSRYLLGKLQDMEGNSILMTEEHEIMLMEIYQNRIIPIFGEYDSKGKKIRDGFIEFYDIRDNPTGMRNTLIDYAKRNGEFITEKYTVKEGGRDVVKHKIIGYKSENPDLFTLIITDHIRKLKKERGYTLKENMDKWIEYSVEFRNLCSFTFIHIVHLNRSISNIERLKFNGEFIYPTGDDVKDSGNLSEECDFLLTMMNPTDEKYGLTKHFGVDLARYPKYRSIHLVESRDTECPLHLQSEMIGAQKYFKTI